jgi:diguanylate cyclase (GGDEF)-like protein
MIRNSLTLAKASVKEGCFYELSGVIRRGSAYVGPFRGTALTAASLLFVALVALLDFGTQSRLSFSLFYLIPAAACAWWGGFAPGVLLSLAGAVAWHVVDEFEDPTVPPTARLWNGLIRFCFLTLASNLVSKLHAGVLRERRLARTDPLTGAANGRTFYETAQAEASRAGRTLSPLTLAYFDLDNFKPLNDRLGHSAGDAALRFVVETTQLHLRNSDLLARLGGDEFALLLPETGAEGATDVLTRLQERLAPEMARKGWPVTLSIGAVTFLRPPPDVDLMIRRVDALMYAAKRKGRARIEHAVVYDALDYDEEQMEWTEGRATARVLCDRPARIWCEGQEGAPSEFAAVRDVSATGICLLLDRQHAAGALLIVESLSPDCRALLARVVRVDPEQRRWKHGCELSTLLSAEELRCWLGEPLPVERSAT